MLYGRTFNHLKAIEYFEKVNRVNTAHITPHFEKWKVDTSGNVRFVGRLIPKDRGVVYTLPNKHFRNIC